MRVLSGEVRAHTYRSGIGADAGGKGTRTVPAGYATMATCALLGSGRGTHSDGSAGENAVDRKNTRADVGLVTTVAPL